MTEYLPKVLVVDDERLIADTLVTILNNENFEAYACYSGEDGLKLCEVLQPDILLCDVMMNGMTGIDLAIELRRQNCSAKVLLISGRAATSDLLQRAEEQGYQLQILAKPIPPQELIKRLRELK